MHCPDDWYQTFFTGITLDLWRAAVTPEMTTAEADSLQRFLQVDPPARLLDVPCGNGRLALELAARGYSMTGIDIAAESIDEGKLNADLKNVVADLRHGDMRDLTALGTFDGAYCWGNSFGYLEDDGNLSFLFAVGSALSPGARLVLEFGTLAETVLPALPARSWYPAGDILMCVDNTYDLSRGRLFTEYVFVRDGTVEKRNSSQQVFLFRELKGLLTSAGFDHVEAFSHADGTLLQAGPNQRAVIVARKGS